jgi:hypothetical protein
MGEPNGANPIPIPGLKDLFLGDLDLLDGLEDLGDLDLSLLNRGEGDSDDLRRGDDRGDSGLLEPEECREFLS